MAHGQREDRVRVQALVIAGDRDHVGARELEGLDGGEVRRLLDEHGRAGIERHRRDERERLLRPAGDEQIVGLGGEPARCQPCRDGLAQRGVAFGGRVLQRAGPGRQRRGEGGREPLEVEQLGRGQATGERDDARQRGEREEFAHGRGANAAQAVGDVEVVGGEEIGHAKPRTRAAPEPSRSDRPLRR